MEEYSQTRAEELPFTPPPNMGFQEPQFLTQYKPDNEKYQRWVSKKQPPIVPTHRQAALH